MATNFANVVEDMLKRERARGRVVVAATDCKPSVKAGRQLIDKNVCPHIEYHNHRIESTMGSSSTARE